MVRESSRLPYRPSALQTWSQRSLFTQDGTLGAKGVVRKLQEAGISNNTMFSPETRICLLLKEFRANMKRVIGTTCHRGQIFPLSLPLLFLLLFGENHPLSRGTTIMH
ncbi:hypothetical protein N7455_012356 [Penicillium solitum]|uniref:uncharacterized protein n=1 Tax=Penicillium solitum TaxID=60172 RepID=UPI0032C4379E|nr:hypothetical protein N7455_012356 [Penicillium solitum]